MTTAHHKRYMRRALNGSEDKSLDRTPGAPVRVRVTLSRRSRPRDEDKRESRPLVTVTLCGNLLVTTFDYASKLCKEGLTHR